MQHCRSADKIAYADLCWLYSTSFSLGGALSFKQAAEDKLRLGTQQRQSEEVGDPSKNQADCCTGIPEVEFKDPVLLIEPCLRFSGFQRHLFLCIPAQTHDYNTIKTGIPGFSQSQIEPWLKRNVFWIGIFPRKNRFSNTARIRLLLNTAQSQIELCLSICLWIPPPISSGGKFVKKGNKNEQECVKQKRRENINGK